MTRRVFLSGFSQVETRAGVVADDFSPSSLVAGQQPKPGATESSRDLRRIDVFARLAMRAADTAIQVSGIDLNSMDRSRCGVVVGSALGGFHSALTQLGRLQQSGPTRVSPFFIPGLMVNASSGSIASRWNLTGPAPGVARCHFPILDAVISSASFIRDGIIESAICGTADAFPNSVSRATMFVLQSETSLSDLQPPSLELTSWASGPDGQSTEADCLTQDCLQMPEFSVRDAYPDALNVASLLSQADQTASRLYETVRAICRPGEPAHADPESTGRVLPDFCERLNGEPGFVLLTQSSQRHAVSLSLREVP